MVGEIEDESDYEVEYKFSFMFSTGSENILWKYLAPNEVDKTICSASVLFPLQTNHRFKAVIR